MAQSKGQTTHLFFLVENALVNEPVENITLGANGDNSKFAVCGLLDLSVVIMGPLWTWMMIAAEMICNCQCPILLYFSLPSSPAVTTDVSALALAQNVQVNGPANSNITFNREFHYFLIALM